ncbi:MAG: hypothetical protein WB538_18255, partial [Candidatus Sulfotelmatobacter sp.]
MPEVKTTTVNSPAATTANPIPANNASATNGSGTKKSAPGLSFRRFFTKLGVSPYDEVEWDLRLAQITDSHGGVIFEQKD